MVSEDPQLHSQGLFYSAQPIGVWNILSFSEDYDMKVEPCEGFFPML